MHRSVVLLTWCLALSAASSATVAAQYALPSTQGPPAHLPGIHAAVPGSPVAPLVQPTMSQAASAPLPQAIEYSDGYRMRAKIHRLSSVAMLPLFGTEAILGQSLYTNRTAGKRDAHVAVAGGIGALFAVNTVTGVWNLLEARKDSNHRKRRLLHGLLMLGADAGFVATAALGPDSDGTGSRATHRAVAFTSIGVATAAYLVMIFGGR